MRLRLAACGSLSRSLFLTSKVDKLLKKYKGRYPEMFQRLDAKYNRSKTVRMSERASVET